MRVLAGLVVATYSQTQPADPPMEKEVTNSWIANTDAPHCGCQIILDANAIDEAWQYVNARCDLTFTYPSVYSPKGNKDPHFVSVASSFMLGRDRTPIDTSSKFQFTGYDEVSNKKMLDILVFYESEDCFKDGSGGEVEAANNWDGIDPSTIWEYYNMTETQKNAMCEFELTCVPEGGPVAGVHLGNFNYDIARSVQTYTVPIWGLEKGENATFQIKDYNNEDNNCMNAKAHEGHGTINESDSCSKNATDGCSNTLTFRHNKDHNGNLEYFEFQPVSPTNNPICFALPIHHIDDYQWQTPSPWDTQQAFADA